jgi:hypothetical protein
MAQLLEGRENVPPILVRNEREFAAEPVDAAWAPGAEAKLLGNLAQIPGLALTNLRVECRSTMCRLQIAVPTTPGTAPPFNPVGQQSGDLGKTLGLEPRWVIGVVDQSRSLQAVAYLWREGMAPTASDAGLK